MNIAKNMEAIFIVAVAMVTATGIATAATSTSKAAQGVAAPVAQVVTVVQASGDSGMTVVNVTAKRLSAAEKAAL